MAWQGLTCHVMIDAEQNDGAEGLTHALLGHDLRAALAEMRTSLHLMNALQLPDEARALLGRSHAVGSTLDRLIDQAVQVCLGQGSAILTTLANVETAAFLGDLRQRWQGYVADSGHRFELIAAGDLPKHFRTDRNALERILANLIGNAIRHTAQGTITLTFKISGGDLLLISVGDEGPGFPAEHLPALQSHFALPPESRRANGGFGLQSVKLLVQAMGGRCNARNRAEGGAEVSLCLPLATSEMASDAAVEPVLAPAPNLTGTRLMLADDSATSRELVSALVHQMGASLTIVKDGSKAIEALERGPLPDALLLDDEMPGATGLQVLAWLRTKGGQHASLPVLALTSHVGTDKVAALQNAGAKVVLAKPVLCPLELGRAILEAQGRVSPSALHGSEITNHAQLTALKRLAQLAGPEAATELFQRLEEDLLTARGGLAAAAKAGSYSQIRAHSHVIIALAGTAGAMGLHDDAVTLNGMAHDNLPIERVIALAQVLDKGLESLLNSVHLAARQSGMGKRALA